MADPSEGRERARQEFEHHIVYEKYLGVAVTVAKDDLGQYTDSLIHEQWIDWLEAFERGRRSLEQERDELRKLVGLKDDLLRAYRTGDHKLADQTLTKLKEIRAAVHKGDS